MRTAFNRSILLGIILVFLVAGCAKQEVKPEAKAAEPAGSYLTIKDDAGRTVVLAKKPERIVVLSPSYLELLYAVDGQAVGRPNSRTGDMPDKAKSLPEVGFVYNINTEKLLSLQPDLVIAFQGMHEKLLPLLESSQIPVIVLKMKTYDDVAAKVKLFSQIAGTTETGDKLLKEMDSRVKNITDKLPPTPKKVAILHATAKSVTLEMETSVAGDIAKRLKLINVAAGSRPLDTDADATPYSLEKLAEQDPELILVVKMGQSAEIESRLRADVENNPAWSSLRAVKQNKVLFLPSDLFLLNPGLKMPEAFETMAKTVYPEVYK